MKLGCDDSEGRMVAVIADRDFIGITYTEGGEVSVCVATKPQALQLIEAITIGITQVWMEEGA